jgi:hypothetical protein
MRVDGDVSGGWTPPAGQVAAQLMAHDHWAPMPAMSWAYPPPSAQPVQPALASAASCRGGDAAVGRRRPGAGRWPDHRGFGYRWSFWPGWGWWLHLQGRAAGGRCLAGHVLGRFGDGSRPGRRTLRRRGGARPDRPSGAAGHQKSAAGAGKCAGARVQVNSNSPAIGARAACRPTCLRRLSGQLQASDLHVSWALLHLCWAARACRSPGGCWPG